MTSTLARPAAASMVAGIADHSHGGRSPPLGPVVAALVMQAAKGRLYGGALADVARIGGQCRALWNLFLAESVARYQTEQKFVFYAEMSARLPKLLKADPRLAGLPHRCAQMTVQKLDRALKDCAKSKGKARRGFPRFKRYVDRSDAFSFVGREVRIADGRMRLPKIGWLRVRGLNVDPGRRRLEAGRRHPGTARLACFRSVRGGGEGLSRAKFARRSASTAD